MNAHARPRVVGDDGVLLSGNDIGPFGGAMVDLAKLFGCCSDATITMQLTDDADEQPNDRIGWVWVNDAKGISVLWHEGCVIAKVTRSASWVAFANAPLSDGRKLKLSTTGENTGSMDEYSGWAIWT